MVAKRKPCPKGVVDVIPSLFETVNVEVLSFLYSYCVDLQIKTDEQYENAQAVVDLIHRYQDQLKSDAQMIDELCVFVHTAMGDFERGSLDE